MIYIIYKKIYPLNSLLFIFIFAYHQIYFHFSLLYIYIYIYIWRKLKSKVIQHWWIFPCYCILLNIHCCSVNACFTVLNWNVLMSIFFCNKFITFGLFCFSYCQIPFHYLLMCVCMYVCVLLQCYSPAN